MTEQTRQFSDKQIERMQSASDKRAEGHGRTGELLTGWLLAAVLGSSAFGLNAALAGDKSWLLFASAIGFGLSGLLVFGAGLCLMQSAIHLEASQSWLQLWDRETEESDIANFKEEQERGFRWEKVGMLFGAMSLVMQVVGIALMITDYGQQLSEPPATSKIKIEIEHKR